LGVFAYNTPTGVIITRVTPYGPASRAGLEPGDRIATVGGYQVGHVNHSLYPLGDELQLRADSQGRVRLLVQNQHDGELLNMDVRLERRRFREPPIPVPLGPPQRADRDKPLEGKPRDRGGRTSP
jgi:predicted metalloprotease with PDZ domain